MRRYLLSLLLAVSALSCALTEAQLLDDIEVRSDQGVAEIRDAARRAAMKAGREGSTDPDHSVTREAKRA